MIYPTGNDFHLSRRATLRTVGAAAVLAVGSGSGGLTSAAQAATATVDASARNAAGFWPNGARLAVSFSLMFEGAASRSQAPAALSPTRSRTASRTCRPTPSSLTAITKAFPACST
jgi:hypothetical protein